MQARILKVSFPRIQLVFLLLFQRMKDSTRQRDKENWFHFEVWDLPCFIVVCGWNDRLVPHNWFARVDQIWYLCTILVDQCFDEASCEISRNRSWFSDKSMGVAPNTNMTSSQIRLYAVKNHHDGTSWTERASVLFLLASDWLWVPLALAARSLWYLGKPAPRKLSCGVSESQ